LFFLLFLLICVSGFLHLFLESKVLQQVFLGAIKAERESEQAAAAQTSQKTHNQTPKQA